MSNSASEDYIKITEPIVIDALRQLAKYSTQLFFNLMNVDPYTYFLIRNTHEWWIEYKEKVRVSEYVMSESNAWLSNLETFPDKLIEPNIKIPRFIIDIAIDLPEINDQANINYPSEFLKMADRLNYGPEETIIAHALAKKKMNKKFWSEAFEYCREKKVWDTYLIGKKSPCSEEERIRLFETFVSYVKKSTYRLKIKKDKESPKFVSLDETPELLSKISMNETPEPILELIENENSNDQLKQLIEENLSDPEQKVIELSYRDNLTQVEIAQKLGISQQMVSKLKRKSINKLRKLYNI